MSEFLYHNPPVQTQNVPTGTYQMDVVHVSRTQSTCRRMPCLLDWVSSACKDTCHNLHTRIWGLVACSGTATSMTHPARMNHQTKCTGGVGHQMEENINPNVDNIPSLVLLQWGAAQRASTREVAWQVPLAVYVIPFTGATMQRHVLQRWM